MNKKLLSIIIVNYNGAFFLENCINSIYESCKTFDFEIIIVDNNSSDNSIQIIEDKFPEAILIKSPANIGFAAGNNLGVNNSNAEFILLLNNDTVLLDNIYPAIELLQTREDIGIVGIKMLNAERNFVASFGKFPKVFNFFKLKTLHIDLTETENKISKNPKNFIEVDWISGAFLLTKKELYTQLDGLDESYFMYVEDVDFNKKVLNLDKKRVFIPALQFIHYVGFNKNREKLLIKSYKIYIRKHKKGIEKIFSLFLLNLNLLVKIILKRI